MKSGELYKSGELLAYTPALPMPPPPDKEVVVVVDETHKQADDDKRDSYDEKELPAVSWKTPTTSYRSTRNSNSAVLLFPNVKIQFP
ncbi:unnamed protein product [Eruca vesicaria subsp. sativa]|uniref:Uncharacterized protein n=1 Tax=Eruca vesicaria subsp. sativa TaxID=29727 RepID=A0ABC8L951_ERUVS|nr:unnamed protein product [Eruca vesicaria subsp. sativa]